MVATTATDAVHLQYGYNRASSRIWRKDLMATANSAEYDELYSYDGLQRLGDMARGTLNSTKTGLTTETFGQCWTLDATGNWQQFRQDSDGNGVWNLEQTRTANPVNEITDIAATTGATWVTPAYDPAGNMTTIPQPQDPTSSYTATYDAWNRLVRLTDDGGSSPGGSSSSSSAASSSSSGGSPTVVAEYEYDARNFRIRSGELIPGTADLEYRSLYYNEQWQLLAERMGGQTFPWVERHYVWGIRYIDDLVFRRRYKNPQGSIHADTLYALQDANWNVVATVGQTDVLPPDQPSPLSERYAYTPYGQPSFLEWDYTPLTASQYGWQYLFTGLRWNANTGLTYARNRDLHSKLGVWTSRDPIAYDGGLSLYQVSDSSPTNHVDPFGLQDPSGADGAMETAKGLCKAHANEQKRLEKLHCIMKWLSAVGNFPQRGCGGCLRGRYPALGTHIGFNEGSTPFPETHFPQLDKAYKAACKAWPNVGLTGVDVNLVMPESLIGSPGQGRNVPYFPGMAIDLETFFGAEKDAIGTIGHEGLHELYGSGGHDASGQHAGGFPGSTFESENNNLFYWAEAYKDIETGESLLDRIKEACDAGKHP
ncbi:MAG: RHS repeat-associated core domain-containing protein [Planctomycetaceae bacterium]